ncbi:MAG: TonB-dependent receptor plug domain-containing protein [Tannerella sp.]|jgi:TonB-dependent SusC/RagA subfamily outer membrane receptor|nr:TonB-dependent receptor plug domain-containing protein [Tannerella sp.]
MKRIYFTLSLLLLFGGVMTAQNVIRGTILDGKTDEPMTGATVIVESTNQGTAADAFGNFEIQLKNSDPVTLKVSMIGYNTVKLGVKDFSKSVFLKMSESINDMDEVVVIGYGTTTKDKKTGSVATIQAEIIEGSAIENVLQSLQGRMSGVNIVQSNGLPGSETSIEIRGLNTFTKSTGCACCAGKSYTNADPLILLDGVPLNSKSVSAIGVGSVGDISSFSLLTPADVERIEILKDADATAIYGSRGSNGVILITSKKGV